MEVPKSNRKGRPSKMTPDREARVLASLRAGNTRRCACACAGISEDTFARWLVASADFADAVTRAEGDAEETVVGALFRHMKTTPQAVIFWLERRRHGEWGKQEPAPPAPATKDDLDGLEARLRAATPTPA